MTRFYSDAAMHKRPASERIVRSVADAADQLLGPRACLLTFHRGAPSETWGTLPNRDFYLDLDFLDRLLSYLTDRGWKIVKMDEAIRSSVDEKDAGRYVNFSIDDCYRDTFEVVVPIFLRHRLPVTLFVTTGIPDGTIPLWTAGLEQTLLDRKRVILKDKAIEVETPESKRAAYQNISTAWDGVDAGCHYREFCSLNGVDEQTMHWQHAISWEMLEALSRNPLVEIGAHSVSHARLASLSSSDALEELRGSRQRLSNRLGVETRNFAFPYGRAADCGPRDFELARQAGYSSAATTRKGLVRKNQNAFSLPRNTINGGHQSLGLMESHLSGLTGFAARMLGRV
jgi:peptidoglycan/xylan/chitin deacetylase (PgdA/CDA1 family)